MLEAQNFVSFMVLWCFMIAKFWLGPFQSQSYWVVAIRFQSIFCCPLRKVPIGSSCFYLYDCLLLLDLLNKKMSSIIYIYMICSWIWIHINKNTFLSKISRPLMRLKTTSKNTNRRFLAQTLCRASSPRKTLLCFRAFLCSKDLSGPEGAAKECEWKLGTYRLCIQFNL